MGPVLPLQGCQARRYGGYLFNEFSRFFGHLAWLMVYWLRTRYVELPPQKGEFGTLLEDKWG